MGKLHIPKPSATSIQLKSELEEIATYNTTPTKRAAFLEVQLIQGLKEDKEYLLKELATEREKMRLLEGHRASLEREARDLNAVRTQNAELAISNLASVVLTALGGGLISTGYPVLGWVILLWGISASIFPVLILKIKDWIYDYFEHRQ